MKIYLGGSLNNPEVRALARTIRLDMGGIQVFDDWAAAHPEADDKWRDYSKARGYELPEALSSHAGQQVYNFDRINLISADVFVLVAPCGKSAHLEAGYMAGLREAGFSKRVIAYIGNDPERYDVMYNFFDKICYTTEEVLTDLRETKHKFRGTGRVR